MTFAHRCVAAASTAPVLVVALLFMILITRFAAYVVHFITTTSSLLAHCFALALLLNIYAANCAAASAAVAAHFKFSALLLL